METRYIRVHYDDDINEKNDVEEILCEKVSDNTYRLIEIPLWAYSLAYADIIAVSSDGYKDWLSFDDFVEFSGNSTIQIVEIINNGINKILPTIEKMLGKDNIRFHSSSYIAVNIPAEIDYILLRLFLKKYESKKIISFKEATLGKNHEYDGCYK